VGIDGSRSLKIAATNDRRFSILESSIMGRSRGSAGGHPLTKTWTEQQPVGSSRPVGKTIAFACTPSVDNGIDAACPLDNLDDGLRWTGGDSLCARFSYSSPKEKKR
jgi:hypothetical protein